MNGSPRSMLIGAAALFAAVQALAAPVNFSLAEYAFNIDGAVSDYLPPSSPPAASPGGVSLSGFNPLTGLGTVSVTFSGAGSHYIAFFVDHEIDETSNTFFNEYGSTSGSLAVGQSWEIDEPGFRLISPGDIFANFSAGALDGTQGVSSSAPDDVSMAMAWNFDLNAGDTATINFLLSESAPGSGFYLGQTDPDSELSVYFSSALTIEQDGHQVPEPSSWALAGVALIGLSLARRRTATPSPSMSR